MRSKAEVMRDLAKVRRRKITIQKLLPTKNNAIGTAITEWVDWKSLWAERGNLWGRDYYAAVAVNEERTVIFTVPWVKFLEEINTNQYRIKYDGKFYDIKQIDILKDDGTWVKLKAIEVISHVRA